LDLEITKTTLSPKIKNALEKAGIITVVDISKKTNPELKKVKGLGKLGMAELILFINKNKIKLAKTKKDETIPLKVSIINKFLKDPKACKRNLEFSVAAKLLKLYPEPEFWGKFNVTFKLNSLCFFLSQRGREIVDKAYYAPKTENKVQQQTVIKLESEKVGEDIVTAAPKSIRDFLND
jgi:hypothetical protein